MSALKTNTLQSILDIGLRLLQERGYNAFSYADIAEAVGIRKASIHYHFPAKQDLVLAVLVRYRQNFAADLERIRASNDDPSQRLKQFFRLYRDPLEDQAKLCLCSMMAAEVNTFPQEVRDEINAFFRSNENWLTDVLESGRQEGKLRLTVGAGEQARILMAFVQGIQLMARSLDDIACFDDAVSSVLVPLEIS